MPTATTYLDDLNAEQHAAVRPGRFLSGLFRAGLRLIELMQQMLSISPTCQCPSIIALKQRFASKFTARTQIYSLAVSFKVERSGRN